MFQLPRPIALPVCALLGCLFAASPARGQRRGGGDENQTPDQFEERLVLRRAERAARDVEVEVHRWHAELTRSYPGKIDKGLERETVLKWFDVLAGGGKEWRRADAPNRRVEALFDRALDRLDLGPVPSIRREEFERFAGRSLRLPDGPDKKDWAEDADRAFRVVDRNGSGVLEAAEWTPRLRAAAKTADADGNRRISKEEYRAYFETRVTAATELIAKARGELTGGAGTGPDLPGDLPSWFVEYDENDDGQIGLYEWREAGRDYAEFLEMDLDGDGLLPPGEYRRYAEKAEERKKAEEEEGSLAPEERP